MFSSKTYWLIIEKDKMEHTSYKRDLKSCEVKKLATDVKTLDVYFKQI
jgi:hypothetical protein